MEYTGIVYRKVLNAFGSGMIDRMRRELSLRTWFDEHDEFQKIEPAIKARLEAIQKLRKEEENEDKAD